MDPGRYSLHSGRKVYIDAIRIFAAFFVIFNHTGTNGFFLFAQREWGSGAFWCYLFFSVFCKVSVPLFLTISGALMLHREQEPLGSLWRKRIGKIFLILLLFITGNYVLDWLNYGEKVTLGKILRTLYTGSSDGYSFWYGHLWYLYAYVAYLCCLPFLRSMVRNLEDRYFYYLIGIALVIIGILPAAEYLLTGNQIKLSGDAVPGWLAMQTVLYPCIGYFLEHRITVRKRDLLWLWPINVTLIGITGLLIYQEAIATQVLNPNVSQGFHGLFVPFNCITVYLTFKCCFSNVLLPKWLKAAVHSVGQSTFGIYLIHIMILESDLLRRLLEVLLMRVNSLLACFIQCGCVMLIGYGITWCLRKIPGLGTLLG